MVTVTHLCHDSHIRTQAENPHFLLTNRSGDYVMLGHPNNSNYDGLFVKEGKTYFKTIMNVLPLEDSNIASVEIDDGVVSRSFENGDHQKFIMKKKGLLIELKEDTVITLDCKKLYDESDQGRKYKTKINVPFNAKASDKSFAKFSITHITYNKHDDYTLHVCIVTNMNVEEIGTWREVSYKYDNRRGTSNTPWVYDAIRLLGKGKVAVSADRDRKTAEQKALDTLVGRTGKEKIRFSGTTQLTWRALRALTTKSGIMAGLPWFFKEWSRDELIALGGIIAAKEYKYAIGVLDKWYKVIRDDGSLPAIYPDEGLTSIDAPGWLGKRTIDILSALRRENKLSLLDKETIKHWRESTGRMIDGIQTNNGLVWNEMNTTWMDTNHEDDGRAGARIEIQALFFALCEAYATLCALTRQPAKKERNAVAHNLVTAIHDRLVYGNKLLDGLRSDGSQDHSVRPNLFLAWYVAPKLFTNSEWKQFFQNALPFLWLEWGGLSSIEKESPQFHSTYTGEDVASYHRGDSWYFVNNMAALALDSVDADWFRIQTTKILQASIDDLLSQGIVGHSSEISSAERQEASGCHAQAWSASTLLEALLTMSQ